MTDLDFIDPKPGPGPRKRTAKKPVKPRKAAKLNDPLTVTIVNCHPARNKIFYNPAGGPSTEASFGEILVVPSGMELPLIANGVARYAKTS